MRRCVLLFAWAILGVCARSGGQTAPTEKGVDLSSPKAALTAAYTALKNGDIAAAKNCMDFKDPRQAELFDILYSQMYRPMKLMHLMEARFGPAGRIPFANAPLEKSIDDLLEKLKTTEIQVNGETAMVVDKKAAVNPNAENELTGITFKKQGEQWKIVASTFTDSAGGGTAELPPDELRLMRALRDVLVAACEATEARLAQGDFNTAEQAYSDYQTRLVQGTRAADAAATQKSR